MSPITLLYILFVLPYVFKCDMIWYYEMNTTIGVEWISSGSITAYSSETNCPNSKAYCWSIQHSSTLTLTPRSTAGYHAVSFTYAASALSFNGNDRCSIQYTTDGTTITSNYQNIKTYSSNIVNDIDTYTGWGTAADNNANGISIKLQSTGNGHECYFNHFLIEGIKITSQPTSSPTVHPTDFTLTPSKTPSTFPTAPTAPTSPTPPTLSPTDITLAPTAPTSPTSPTTTTLIPTNNPTHVPTAYSTVYPTTHPTSENDELFEELSPWEWPFEIPSIIIVYIIIAWFILFCCIRGWCLKLGLRIYGKEYESRVVGKTLTLSRKGGQSCYIAYELCGTVKSKRVSVNTFNQFMENQPIGIRYDPCCPTYNHKVYASYNGWIVCLWVMCIYLTMGGIAVAVLFGMSILTVNKVQKAGEATGEAGANYYNEHDLDYIYYNPPLLIYSISFGIILCLLTILCQCICCKHCGKSQANLTDHSIQNNEMAQMTACQQDLNQVNQPIVVQQVPIIYVQPVVSEQPPPPTYEEHMEKHHVPQASAPQLLIEEQSVPEEIMQSEGGGDQTYHE